MVFKVVIRHPSVDDDEHNYYGVVFPNRDIGQIKQLKFVPPGTLEAKFSFASAYLAPSPLLFDFQVRQTKIKG